MVTKRDEENKVNEIRLILAKIHMVTKPQIYITIYLKCLKVLLRL